jgi:hypothetical protein
VLQDESHLKLPKVVKIAKNEAAGATGSIDDQPETSDYRVEPGDIEFDAKPVDLLRRLRRIFDNARTTVEERGVTTLHLARVLAAYPFSESQSAPLPRAHVQKSGPEAR